MSERTLAWEACRNARDLGGLPLAGGGATRFGSIVRSDTLRQLTPAGWAALTAYGVETVLDLRFQVEIEADKPLDEGPGGLDLGTAVFPRNGEGRPPGLRTVAVSLLGEPDRALGEHFERISRAERLPAASTRAVYLEMLGRFPEHYARAVAAVADASGCVVVHCHAGKDRTGLLVALLLAVAGVPAEEIAADYALSGPNLEAWLERWLEEPGDEAEREHRRRVGASPAEAMLDVLAELESAWGGAAGYLAAAGLGEGHLERVGERLR